MKTVKVDKTRIKHTTKRLILLVLASLLMALNLKTFCIAAGIIPGGFSGIAVLFQETMSTHFNIKVPFSLVYYVLNAFPIYIGFRFIGKWFTLFSCLVVFLVGILTDWVPLSLLSYLDLHDSLLCAVFGGCLNAIAITLCLLADATSGGTDFIAIYLAERQDRNPWGLIFVGNCMVLVVAAILFEPEKALYSIIFQFAQTMGLNNMYKGYQRKTLLIITDKHDEVYSLIRDKTHHDATQFTGIGKYKNAERTLLYSVVSANDAHVLIGDIKKIDPAAFINVLKTDFINGQFYSQPKN
jgi:uncharacterized membrane-anchored protein YitT (DUF2179 family)